MPPTITDYFGKASVDTDYAIATTVKTTRTTGVTVLEAFDLSKYADDTPVFFVTYKKVTDPVTEITSVVDLVSWKGIVNTAANTLTNLTVAPGYTDIGNDIGDFVECIPTSYWENSLIEGIFVGHNPDGTFKKSALQSALGNDGQLVQALDEIIADFVQSGGVWATVSGVNASMTALVGYIDGYRNTIAAIASKSFTVSKDTYIDVYHDSLTDAFSLVYTEVANGADAPALAANSLRLAKVVTSAAAITSIVQSGSDTLGNSIKPTGAIGAQNIDSASFPAFGAQSDVINAAESTASASWGDLATVGPSVTVNIGASGLALVTLYANISNTSSTGRSEMSFAMSGANTQAATTGNALMQIAVSAGVAQGGSAVYLLSGLNPGATTFTAKYERNVGGTSTFSGRKISVVPL